MGAPRRRSQGGGRVVADRLYPVYVQNPVRGRIPQDVLEQYGLVEFYSEPAVTTVSKSWGVSWNMLHSAVSLTRKGRDYKQEWADAADRGTALHEIAEALAIWGPTGYKPEDAPEEVRPFAARLIKFWTVHAPHALKSEFLVWSREHGYAGRGDLLAVLRPWKLRCLIDFKTVREAGYFKRFPKGFIENEIELVARARAMQEWGETVEACALVRVGPDGEPGYHCRLILPDEWPPLMEEFLRRLEHYRFKKERGD